MTDSSTSAGPVALVTGGEKGIGRVVAQRLVEAGHRVLVPGLDEAAGNRLADAFPPAQLRFMRCDVGHEPDVAAALRALLDWTGRLDLLVANAQALCAKAQAR